MCIVLRSMLPGKGKETASDSTSHSHGAQSQMPPEKQQDIGSLTPQEGSFVGRNGTEWALGRACSGRLGGGGEKSRVPNRGNSSTLKA